jgi:putative transcriptional regulator
VARTRKRDLFGEMLWGVRPMRGQHQVRITLRSHHITPLSLPSIDEHTIRNTRERLHMSRSAFAHRLGVNPRTLERWEQGRSKPNDQAAALILLVRRYPDTLTRLAALAAG